VTEAREPVLVDRPVALAELVEALRGEPRLALDTESNSFHVYRERVCLLQLSTASADFVVDPIALDPRPLGPLLSDGRTVVLHGAEYGWWLPRLFDTMAAARRLGRQGLGLSALVEAHFGARLSKEFQRSDWGRRPLSPEQLRYAALDTRFLLPLHDLLGAELAQRGLVAEAEEEFRRIGAAEPRPKVFDPEGWRHIKAARLLDVAGRRALRALWQAREERASAVDRPPFKVLGEQTLVEIARRLPRTPAELARVPGVTPVLQKRVGDLVAAALEAAAREGT